VRISRHVMYMEMARIVAKRGTCPRLCVGAILVADNRIFMGYNGSEPGEPHCTDDGCIMFKGSCIRTLHAEANAIKRFRRSDVRNKGTLYITHSPCEMCAQFIVDSPVDTVYFETPYGNGEPLNTLLDNDITVHRIMPNGYILTGDKLEITK
jgi:dCMP deaminase